MPGEKTWRSESHENMYGRVLAVLLLARKARNIIVKTRDGVNDVYARRIMSRRRNVLY